MWKPSSFIAWTRTRFAALLLGIATAAAGQTSPLAVGPETALHQRVKALEAGMSDAFNRCDIEALQSYFDPELEFYHDGAGATRTRERFLQNVKKNACNRFTRRMIPETLEVWRLGSFGAIYSGRYQACAMSTGKCQSEGRVLTIVQANGEALTVTRVVSYDHKELQ